MQVVVKVHLCQVPYTTCYVSEDRLIFLDQYFSKSIGLEADDCVCDQNLDENGRISSALKYTANALFLQPFVKCLRSYVYRKNVVSYLNSLSGCPDSRTVHLRLILKPPEKEIIDYAWNDRMLRLTWTKVEIENAFSWLSTLGGAYSALGDYFEHCAEEAGRISIRQYKLSKMLGDEALAARSKLYFAIAIAQKGRLHSARDIIRTINKFAFETHDTRLRRMCQGVWAKLRYMKTLKRISQQGGQGEGNK